MRNTQRLTKTYITLSIKDITETVKLTTETDTEKRILQMVCNFF